MQEPLLEDLFAAFRDQGDAAALATVFDRTAGELLTLALHLAPETSAAEDLVQATFLAAIQGASTFERGRRLMPWLVGILANQAARARRDRARVIDPLRVESRAEPDPARTSEQREVFATLTRAIDELPDACREPVRRHLLDGERAVDIARADGTAPGTVRMQILRGLERLRRTVPASLLSVTPLVIESGRMTAVRATVVSAARSHAALAATSAGAGATSASVWSIVAGVGGTFVTLKLLIAAACVVVIGLVSWRLSERSASPALAVRPQSTQSSSDIDAPGPAVAPEREGAATSADASRTSSTPAATKAGTGWWLTGEVRGLSGLDPTQTTIRARPLPGEEGALSTHAGADGRFEIDVSKCFTGGTKPQYLLVNASHPAQRDANATLSVDAEKAADGSTRRVEWNVDLELQPFAILSGRVDVPRDDVPPSTAVVLFHDEGTRERHDWKKLSSTQRHADGSFELRVESSGEALLLVHAEGFVPVCAPVHFERGVRSEVGTLQLVRGALALEGHLALGFSADGKPHGFGASVRARRSGSPPAVAEEWHGVRFGTDPHGIARVEIEEQTAHVDADGAFRFHGLPPGEWDLVLDLDDVVQIRTVPITCAVPCPPAVLGAELDRWNVHVVSKGKPVHDVALIATLGDVSARGSTDEEGRTQVVAPFRLGFELSIAAPGFADKRLTVPPATHAVDGTLEIELALADDPRATLILRPADAADAPELAQVTLTPVGMDCVSIDKMFRDGAGTYELDGVPPGRWSVLVQPAAKSWFGMPGGSDVQDLRFEVVLAPHERRVESIRFEKGGRVELDVDGWNGIRAGSGPWAKIHLRDASGRAVTAPSVVRESNNGAFSLVSYDDQIALYAPSMLRSSLPPGVYALEVDDPVWTAHAIQFQVKAGETTKVRVAVARR